MNLKKIQHTKNFQFLGIKKIIFTMLLILVLPAVFAGECCNQAQVDGQDMKFVSITISYMGTTQAGDIIEVYDGSNLIESYDGSSGEITHDYSTKSPTWTTFKLIRGSTTISETDVHTSCSRDPVYPDGNTNSEWEVTEATFAEVNPDSSICVNLECGPDSDGDGVGDLCDTCPDEYNPADSVEQCKCDDINSLTIQYTGSSTATTATVYEDNDATDPNKIRATVPVLSGDIITVSTSDLSNGEFKTETTILVGTDEGTFHTSCSRLLGPGVVDYDLGLFEIISADLVNPKDCIIETGSQPPCEDPCTDYDSDGVCDEDDNCPSTYNPDQIDSDQDGTGDACEDIPCSDIDSDNVCDPDDNCISTYNPNQQNSDNDNYGDACDNCVYITNELQGNVDGDLYGDVCDNCKTVSNNDQADQDLDDWGDVCDNCPKDYNPDQKDKDNDQVGDVCDNDGNSGDIPEFSAGSIAAIVLLILIVTIGLIRKKH